MDYRRVFHLLWRIKRVEWSLASAWRLQTSATHIRVSRQLDTSDVSVGKEVVLSLSRVLC